MTVQKPFFPTLEAKISEYGILKKDIAQLICVEPRTLSLKLGGKTDFTLREAFLIHSLFPDVSIEILFSTS